MSQDWNQGPQNLPPSGFGQPQGGAPFGAPAPGPQGGFGGGTPAPFGQPPAGGPPPGAPAPFGAPPGGGAPFGAPPGGGAPFGAPPGGGGPMPGGGENNLALASIICGGVSVAGLLCCCIPFLNYASYILVPLAGLAAIITGILGLREANQTGVRKNEAIAGIVMGSVGFVMIAIAIVLAIVGIGAAAAIGAANPH
ncbi:MAG: DUF4190 domain-containing protein [Sandaracinaceae bacterium]|nr:DUF4190 domain-containing protein [Sandaracinaceae bacterium]